MMRTGKVYIYAEDPKAIVILESPHPSAGKEAYAYIKKRVPAANIGVMGARDIQTLRRTQRELKPTHVTRDVNKFLKAVYHTKNKTLA
jgi:hypothetical protein